VTGPGSPVNAQVIVSRGMRHVVSGGLTTAATRLLPLDCRPSVVGAPFRGLVVEEGNTAC